MKSKTRWIVVLILVLVTALPVFGGGQTDKAAMPEDLDAIMNKTGYPVMKAEGIEFTMANRLRSGQVPYKDQLLIHDLEEKTGVKINWMDIEATVWEEQKQLMLASNELPDAFMARNSLKQTDLVTYGAQGALIPLNDLIEDYAPKLMKQIEKHPSIRRIITFADGNIYGLPRAFYSGFTLFHTNLFVNQGWLGKLGLEVPDTLDEMEAVLTAFKNRDPNGNGKADEIPFSHASMFAVAAMYGSFGLTDSVFGDNEVYNHFVIEKDKVVFTPLREEWKEATAYFHGWYAKGLIDQESLIQEEKDLMAKGKAEPEILGFFAEGEPDETVGTERAKHWAYMRPVAGSQGDRLWPQADYKNNNIRFAFSITSQCAYPEVVMRWVDEFYDPYFGIQGLFGKEGYVLEKDANGMYDFMEFPEGMSVSNMRSKYAPRESPAIIWIDEWDRLIAYADTGRDKNDNVAKYYRPYVQNTMPGVNYSLEETEFLTTKGVDIQSFVTEKRAVWLLRGGIEQEYDEFVKQLKSMGIDEYIELQQKAYKRFTGF